MDELWKPISGYEGLYEISNLGRVKSVERIVPSKHHGLKRPFKRIRERILKPNVMTIGYLSVALSKIGCETNFYIHRLVAEAFVANLNSFTFVDHIDGNRQNARADNLAWVTQVENISRAWRKGSWRNRNTARGERTGTSKLKENQVIEIRALYPLQSAEILAAQFGVATDTIFRVINRKTWAHI